MAVAALPNHLTFQQEERPIGRDGVDGVHDTHIQLVSARLAVVGLPLQAGRVGSSTHMSIP
jgi:hypothetical protein